MKRAQLVVSLSDRWRLGVRTFGPALAIVIAQQVLFPSKDPNTGAYLWGLVIQGVTVGLLSALVALGMALVYRANRVLNFAQGDLGLLPVSLAVDLILYSGLSYFISFFVGLLAAAVVGAAVELLIVRRFFRAPRLILSVATIGIAQLLAFAALLLPQIWGKGAVNSNIDIPIHWTREIAPYVFNGDTAAAWIVAPLAMVAVAMFLRFTDIGVATRAAADRADRAALLGIPVGRLHTCVWTIATVLSFIALFLRASITGLPFGGAVGFSVLLSALAALMLGRLTNLPAVAASAVALGLLEVNVSWNDKLSIGPFHFALGNQFVIAPVLSIVIIVALLVMRPGKTRAERDETSSWSVTDEIRPVPRELRMLTEVRVARAVGFTAVAVFLVALPYLPWLGRPGNTLKAAAVLLFAIVSLSIAILTGWAGQVSLGQMGFVAIGAALGAKAATDWGMDLALAIPLIGLAGAAVAVVVGLPALRLRGLYLAVTTLAFALATIDYFLNPEFFAWVPTGRFEPRPLLGVWDYAATTEGTYQLCLIVFVLCVVAISGIRGGRTGRVLVALRENERGVSAYGVSVVAAKLTAFAISGFFASVAGVVLVQLNGQFTLGLFPPEENFITFTAAVVGGLGSLLGAVLGAIFLKGGQWFLSVNARLAVSGAGVLVVLLLLPGGLGAACFRLRDLALRSLARRHGVVVPSLLADVATDASPDEAVQHLATEPVAEVPTAVRSDA